MIGDMDIFDPARTKTAVSNNHMKHASLSRKSDKPPWRSGGGAATASGTTFQEDVAAWLAVQVLAERATSAGLGLPPDITLEILSAECFNPVDDLKVATSVGGQLFFQCKSTIDLSRGTDSEFAKVVRQFVRQVRVGHKVPGQLSRQLSAETDRMILAVGERSPASVTTDLRKALECADSANSSAGLHASLAGLNTNQSRALSCLEAHFTREWQSASGALPAPGDWLTFLHSMRVRKFDLTIDGSDRREADWLLRNQVLQAAERAADAWATLIVMVRGFAPDHRSGDRLSFRQRLIAAGLDLQGSRNYRDIIGALRQYSRLQLDSLKQHAATTYRGQEIRIARTIVRTITEMASQTDLLIIGEPGAGKSGCIYEFARSRIETGLDCIVLRVESLDTTTIATLSRDLQIPTGTTLVDVLANWPVGHDVAGNEQPRCLAIDALDATRDGRGISTICDLVQHIRSRAPGWRVLASIREFDLKHHDRVREVFAGQPHELFRSPSFRDVRHVCVPPLSNEELSNAQQQIPELSFLFETEGLGLRNLVQNPFNLKLLVDLLSHDISTCELAATRAQVQLLDRYWAARLGPDTDGRISYAVRMLVAEMLRQRRLTTRLSCLGTSLHAYATEFEQLQRSGILQSSPSSALAGSDPFVSFSHNILLDYAAARVWLGDIGPDPIDELERQENQDLLLFARPSIHLAVQRLWHMRDTSSTPRATFWDRVRAFESSRIRPLGKIIPSAVAAAELQDVADISPLLDQLQSLETRTADEAVFQHVIAGVLARTRDPSFNWRITGSGAPPWLDVAADIARRDLPRCAWQLRLLLLEAEREGAPALTLEQTSQANRAARALLLWSAAGPGVTATLMTAISMACKTMQAGPQATVAALEPILSRTHSEDWYDLLRPIAENFTQVALSSPRFACRAIRAAYARDYGHDDFIDQGSRILPLRFNKGDSLESARRTISESFSELATLAPALATILIFRFVRLAVGNRYSSRPSDDETMTFQFRGHRSRLAPDYSIVWLNSGHVQHESWHPAVEALRLMLGRLAGDPAAAANLGRVLDVFAKHARPAILWTTLMRAGAAAPATLGLHLLDLMRTPALLTAIDTEVAAGDLLHSVWPHLPTEIRVDVEHTIVALPIAVGTEECEAFRQDRDRLLGCIPEGALETAEARDALAQVRTRGGPPENQSISRMEARSLSDEDYLRERGVDLASPANQGMLELTNILKNMAASATQQPLQLSDFEGAFPSLIDLQTLLVDAANRGIHRDVIARAESAVYSALSTFARSNGLTTEHMHYIDLRRALLAASADPRPQASETIDSSPRRGPPSYVGGQPRIEAAQGLIALARILRNTDTEIFDAVLRLSRDPHWAVRFQVRTNVNALWKSNRPLMWQIIEDTSREETDLGVLRFFTHMLVNTLLPADPDRIDGLVSAVQARIDDTEGYDSIAPDLACLLVRRIFSEGHEASMSRLNSWADNPIISKPYLQAVFQYCRDLLTCEAVNGDPAAGERIRIWAFSFQRSALDRILEVYQELTQRHSDRQQANWPREDLHALESLFHLVNVMAGQLQFASGAAASAKRLDWSEADDHARRFLREGTLLLERLCDCPFAYPAYKMLETLRFLAPCNPPTVFVLIARCLQAAREDHIQFEHLAVELVVGIVESYLSFQRLLIQNDPVLRRAVLDVLDLFTATGWPDAVRLVYRLEEIYR